MYYVKINNRERRKAINKLRKEDQLVKSCSPNDTSLSHHSVDELVIGIARSGLNDKSHLKEYSRRICLLRKNLNLTQKSVAEKLSVTHVAVTHEEQGNKKKISQYFLLGFSLLYHVSPLYLIGETNNENCYSFDGLLAPMDFLNPEICTAVETILVNTYRPIDGLPDLNSTLLGIILKLCDASFDWSRAIRHTLLDAPAIKVLNANKLRTINPNISWHSILSSQLRKLVLEGKEDKLREYKENQDRLYDRLYNWGVSDFNTLNLFAHISSAGPQLKEAVCLFLKHGGFLSDQNHFQQNVQKNLDSKNLHEVAD